MKKAIVAIRNKGFTLIEVLVTIVVIGVLAAVVIPAVTAQVTAGDASRVISDVNNIRTGIENFDIAVRQFPGDLDDLINMPGTVISATSTTNISAGTVDADLNGTTYITPDKTWNGPYIEAVLPVASRSSTLPNAATTAMSTGYAATLNNRFVICDLASQSACTAGTSNYATIEIDNLTIAQSASLNDLIDGTGESASSTSGKFRAATSGTWTGFYFATPIK